MAEVKGKNEKSGMLGNVVSGVVGAVVGAAAGAAAVVLSDPNKRKQVEERVSREVRKGEKEVKKLVGLGQKALKKALKEVK